MFRCDIVLGLHALIPVTYACFAPIVCLGFWLRRQRRAGRIGVAALTSSGLFFAITDFAVWADTNMYLKTVAANNDGLVSRLYAARCDRSLWQIRHPESPQATAG